MLLLPCYLCEQCWKLGLSVWRGFCWDTEQRWLCIHPLGSHLPLSFSVMQSLLPVNILLALPPSDLEAEAFFPCLGQVQFQHQHLDLQPLAPSPTPTSTQAICPLLHRCLLTSPRLDF